MIVDGDGPLFQRVVKQVPGVDGLKVWVSASPPSAACDVWLVDNGAGKCWELVKTAQAAIGTCGVRIVGYLNVPGGLDGTLLHFLVDQHGPKWFMNEREILAYVCSLDGEK
ncbi:MAG: hypothetical protein JSS66_04675 [Armatimonadetes bacterium]|nr:hypothetical protein [Armatimonadota bacterium]